MASGPPPDTEGTQAPVPVPVPVPVRAKPKRRWSRMSLAFIALLVLLCIAAAGALRWIDTQSGHRFLISRVETLRPASGLRISVGSIEGSVFRKMRLRDLRFSDDEGR
jgi:translocation and assembly module TamB